MLRQNCLKQKKKRTTAMTIVELVVASALVGIALLGVVAVDYAIRTARLNASQSNLISMRLAAKMIELTQAAAHTTGTRFSGVGDQIMTEGIYANNTAGSETICFRYDTDNDPNTYVNDLFQCFRNSAGTGLLRTTDKADPRLGPWITPIVSPLILTPTAFFTVNRVGPAGDGTDPIQYIEFTLSTRANPASAMHPITNPQYSQTTRVYPAALSQ